MLLLLALSLNTSQKWHSKTKQQQKCKYTIGSILLVRVEVTQWPHVTFRGSCGSRYEWWLTCLGRDLKTAFVADSCCNAPPTQATLTLQVLMLNFDIKILMQPPSYSSVNSLWPWNGPDAKMTWYYTQQVEFTDVSPSPASSSAELI